MLGRKTYHQEELLAESSIDNDGVLRGGNVVKLNPGHSVLKLDIGAPITLTAAELERLAAAFSADLEAKFVARR